MKMMYIYTLHVVFVKSRPMMDTFLVQKVKIPTLWSYPTASGYLVTMDISGNVAHPNVLNKRVRDFINAFTFTFLIIRSDTDFGGI